MREGFGIAAVCRLRGGKRVAAASVRAPPPQRRCPAWACAASTVATKRAVSPGATVTANSPTCHASSPSAEPPRDLCRQRELVVPDARSREAPAFPSAPNAASEKGVAPAKAVIRRASLSSSIVPQTSAHRSHSCGCGGRGTCRGARNGALPGAHRGGIVARFQNRCVLPLRHQMCLHEACGSRRDHASSAASHSRAKNRASGCHRPGSPCRQHTDEWRGRRVRPRFPADTSTCVTSRVRWVGGVRAATRKPWYCRVRAPVAVHIA